MKRYCKDIDITDRKLISNAVYDCLYSNGKYKRADVIRLYSEYTGLQTSFIEKMINEFGKDSIKPIIETIIDGIRQELIDNKIVIKDIFYRERTDPSSGKVRTIGIQNIKQQLYDYVAVYGLKPFLNRIGVYQCASIKGRGQIYGIKAIKRWMRNKEIRYGVKADVQKCYESIDRNKLMVFLNKHIKNNLLIWLIERLINTFDKGLSIGSYLSQYLCNLYMSQLYHEISENMYRVRKHKDGTNERINLVHHVLIFMDDILILGSNIKDLHKAIKLTIKYCKDELGLKIKETWTAFKTKLSDRKNDSGQLIDIMGFRVYRWHITIRRYVFKRIRRSYMRLLRKIKTHKYIPVSLSRKCLSYYGIIKNSNNYKFKKKYKVNEIIKVCKKVVGKFESKIYRKTNSYSYC